MFSLLRYKCGVCRFVNTKHFPTIVHANNYALWFCDVIDNDIVFMNTAALWYVCYIGCCTIIICVVYDESARPHNISCMNCSRKNQQHKLTVKRSWMATKHIIYTAHSAHKHNFSTTNENITLRWNYIKSTTYLLRWSLARKSNPVEIAIAILPPNSKDKGVIKYIVWSSVCNNYYRCCSCIIFVW